MGVAGGVPAASQRALSPGGATIGVVDGRYGADAARGSPDDGQSFARACGEAGEADYLTAAHELAKKCWPRVEEALKAAKWDLETAHIDGDGGCLERPR